MNQLELESRIWCKLLCIIAIVESYVGVITSDSVDLVTGNIRHDGPRAELKMALQEIKTQCHTALQLLDQAEEIMEDEK